MKKRTYPILLTLILILALGITSCGSNSEKTSNTEKSSGSDADAKDTASEAEDVAEEIDLYEIAFFETSFGEDAALIRSGFEDTIRDLLGEGTYHITDYKSYTDSDATAKSHTIANNDSYDLILTYGETAIRKMASSEHETPIISTGILDFQTLLGTSSAWDTPSGRNFTGVSSRSSMTETLSLMIESVPDIKTFGFITSPNDSDSLYQIRILESYMDQAGIPWKEYSLLATDAYSIATTPETEDEDPAMSDEEAAELIENANRAVLTLAATECNAIFIPSGTDLYDQKDLIFSILDNANLPIITGDSRLATRTLTCLYLDTYEIGKEAAEMAVEILVNEKDPSEMEFESVSTSTLVKLYQDSVAERFEMEFPKTFYEVDEYLANLH